MCVLRKPWRRISKNANNKNMLDIAAAKAMKIPTREQYQLHINMLIQWSTLLDHSFHKYKSSITCNTTLSIFMLLFLSRILTLFEQSLMQSVNL